MAETTWSEEGVEAPKKKGIPIWVWGCGGGCLLFIVVGLIAAVWGAGKIKDAFDADVVWPKISEVIPFEERPENYKVGGGSFFGTDLYFIFNESEMVLGILVGSEAEDQEEIDKVFAGDLSESGFMGVGEVQESESILVDVKGRECRALRFKGSDVSMPFQVEGGSKGDSIMLIDLSTGAKFTMLELIDMSGGVTDQEDVTAFFEPFDPWR